MQLQITEDGALHQPLAHLLAREPLTVGDLAPLPEGGQGATDAQGNKVLLRTGELDIVISNSPVDCLKWQVTLKRIAIDPGTTKTPDQARSIRWRTGPT